MLLVGLFLLVHYAASDCFNKDFSLSSSGKENEQCFVVFDGQEIDSGYVDDAARHHMKTQTGDTFDCFEAEQIFEQWNQTIKPFSCLCQGTICNGHAVTGARHALNLPDVTPEDPYGTPR